MPRRILIIKLSSIGDVVHALPAAKSLRQGFPDAFICWAVHKSCRDIVEGSRYLDEVYVLESKSLAGIIAAGRDLRARKFDTAIDMQGLFRSSLLAWISGAPERIGFSGHQEMHHLFINKPAVKPGYVRPAPYCQMEFAVAAGGPRIEPIAEIAVSDENRAQAAALLAPAIEKGGAIVAINPGAAWETKRWAPERFAATADLIADRTGSQIIIIGGPTDQNAAAFIASSMSHPAINLSGKTTLKTLCAIFEQCALFVSGDTGPMHIAAAMSTPVLALFGPTDPEKTGPVGQQNRVLQHKTPCGPCRNKTCNHHTCMERLTIEEVARVACEMLLKKGKP